MEKIRPTFEIRRGAVILSINERSYPKHFNEFCNSLNASFNYGVLSKSYAPNGASLSLWPWPIFGPTLAHYLTCTFPNMTGRCHRRAARGRAALIPLPHSTGLDDRWGKCSAWPQPTTDRRGPFGCAIGLCSQYGIASHTSSVG